MGTDQSELPGHNGGIAQGAGGGFPQGVTPVTHQVGHDAGEGKHVAAGSDLGAQGGAIQGDGAFKRLSNKHFHLHVSPRLSPSV